MSFTADKSSNPSHPDPATQNWRRFGLAVLALGLIFFRPLFDLIRLALANDVHSHVLLVPFVSGYLVWTDRRHLPPTSAPSFGIVIFGSLGAAAALLTSFVPALRLPADLRLSLQILALILCIVACGGWFLGRNAFRHCVFSFGFLAFAIPMPEAAIDFCETTLQHASAEVSAWAFTFAGPPVVHDGLYFRLPGMAIKVAQECSGFRSTLVLFMVSVLASRMFLHTPWKRAVLVLTIFPLGVVRNAFRIWTLATLSVKVNPEIMDSWLHHRGGPIFFALSLAPLYLLLFWLHRSERIHQPALPPSETPTSP